MLVRVICFHHTADCERARVRRSRTWTWLDGGQSPLWPAVTRGIRDHEMRRFFLLAVPLDEQLGAIPASADRVSGWSLGCGVLILGGGAFLIDLTGVGRRESTHVQQTISVGAGTGRREQHRGLGRSGLV